MQYYSRLTLSERWREVLFLLKANSRSLRSESFAAIFREVDEYRELFKRYCARDLENAKVFEIGYGRRPDRLVALMSQGVDASGVDLLLPLVELNPSNLLKVGRINGVRSTVRSVVRYLLFDIARWRTFAEELSRRGYKLRIESHTFIAHDVTTLDVGAGEFDVIFAEDVFEHIPERNLHIILEKLSQWLKPNGICLIRPNVFTGVWGGHLCEQLRSDGARGAVMEPWEHLRKNRFRSTVYLNRLTRKQYRNLFRRYFDIVEERVKDADLIRSLLTPDIARELQGYPEEELLSNQVMFVLRPKDAGSHEQ